MAEWDNANKPATPATAGDTAAADAEPTPELPTQPEPHIEESVAEDSASDAAVDDIVKSDDDAALKAQDEAAEAFVMEQSRWERLKEHWVEWWQDPRKRWGSIAAIVLVLAVVFALPFTRYNVLGLALKTNVTVEAVDSKTGAPVSGAEVELAGAKAETQANGKAKVHANMGSGSLLVSKKYYSSYTHGELVSGGKVFKASLVALGHQVKVKVTDKVSGNPLADAVITVQGAKAKTNKLGTAVVVTASNAATQDASVSLNGFNTAKVSIKTGANVLANTFTLTPSGKLYFLSNLSGKIDVVKTNLDGTARQTVLAGTGSEDPNSTSLLASRDWKYLALLSKRAGDKASVYLIDTTNGDKLTTIDEGNADFSLVGWSGDNFVYQVTRDTVNDWQADKYAIKSYDATNGQTLLLDQTQASGTDQYNWMGQTFGKPYLINNQVVYTKGWNAAFNQFSQLNSKQAELDVIDSDGSGHRVVKTFSVGSGVQTSYVGVDVRLYEPDELYIADGLDASGTVMYKYDNGQVSTTNEVTQDTFYSKAYPTFLLSPSSNATFWAEQRDGKNTLFVGDQTADNQKQIASLSDYTPYGWYTDKYLLVSKNSSELYIMPVSGGTPLKITDYYKPTINYQGYGGGYGGL